MKKTIRIWDGCKVIVTLTVNQEGSYSCSGRTGGAHGSELVDIEIDPFDGMIVDHATTNPPLAWRDER